MATAGDFYWVQPNEMFRGGTVTGGAATSYTDEALVDGKPGVPTRATNGSPSWTIGQSPAVSVSLVAVCNHTIDAARNITFGGDITKVLVGPPLPSNGIRLNPWGTLSAVSATSVTLAITSNTTDVIIGEVIIGTRRTLERNLAVRPSFGAGNHGTVQHESEFDSLMGYDKGFVARPLSGTVVLSDTGLAAVLDWYDSTRGNTLPSLIVPNSNVQDAWLVKFASPPQYQPGNKNVNDVTLSFIEFPRSRW
jgi:hypothetical protein